MTTTARKRLIRDLKSLQKPGNFYGIHAHPADNDIYFWSAVIYGPEDTAWEGGTFKLTMQFTEEYPNKPPNVKFISKIFHPNVYTDGSICLNLLQSDWSPLYEVSAILTAIQSLLSDPNTSSPGSASTIDLSIIKVSTIGFK
ncbi:ubiquitin-conjugating enzyme e2 2 [Anaeramoeba flamelloides]|uniref:Ubiquitin-conjugating enzyme e2 2 n=1 Tax=Anaeramoeba flamelloides TaxID=1746091 RepID=A0ABQ8X5B6_9EUKA|nr:ubiquitin-conjugating enzyme e2 2 [Anaeramoeba flamelloides]